ncbi:hypothetical protein MANES_09G054200v8 [Manihot esculenta]|uniref:Uncharacterized protein n=1 Tax=Manihot esculenta TaxID=3983 RepID=A0A2C9V856_MANES|nr:hypothetical protein MANES_09G054200v8 [Manihot esculenta]
MAADAASETSKFPAADVEKELHPGHNEKLEVDGVSSGIVTSRDLMEEEKATKKKKEMGRRDPMQTLKTTIIVSAAIVAVAGAVFAITRKLREK